jgi:hypothetical protein
VGGFFPQYVFLDEVLEQDAGKDRYGGDDDHPDPEIEKRDPQGRKQ